MPDDGPPGPDRAAGNRVQVDIDGGGIRRQVASHSQPPGRADGNGASPVAGTSWAGAGC
jgi:hypothetical protein